MTDKTNDSYNVLFLCTGNSARSIIAEAILRDLGAPRFCAFSAGSFPKAEVNPHTLTLLRRCGHATEGLRAKSWDEFAGPEAPKMDLIFTVCDAAAGEVCPVWPGHPMTAHWPFRDPAAFVGSEAAINAVFAEVYGQIHQRISLLVNLPLASLDRLALKHRLDELGREVPNEGEGAGEARSA